MEYQVRLRLLSATFVACIFLCGQLLLWCSAVWAQNNLTDAPESQRIQVGQDTQPDLTQFEQNETLQNGLPVSQNRPNIFGDQLILPLSPYEVENRRRNIVQDNGILNRDREFSDNLFENENRPERQRRRRNNLEPNNTELRNVDVNLDRPARRRQRANTLELETQDLEQGGQREEQTDQDDDLDQIADENQGDDLGRDEEQNEAEDRFEEEFLRAEAELAEQEGEDQNEDTEQQNNQNARNADRLQRQGLQARARRALNGLQNTAGNNLGARRTTDDVADLGLADTNDITGAINRNPIADTYAPEGMPFGSFRLFPELIITALYSDNPSASQDNGPGDNALVVRPGFSLQSNWSRHQLSLQGQLTKGYYEELTSENIEEWFLAINGRLDIQQNHFVELESRFDVTQGDRGDVDNLNSDSDRANTETFLFAGTYNVQVNRLTFRVRGELINNDFEDVSNGVGGTINNDDQDYLQHNLITTLGYTYHPGLYIYTQGTVTKNDYRTSVDDLGFDRNSEGQIAEGGIIIDLTSKVRLSAQMGYEWSYAADPRFEDSESLVYNFQLNYRPSSLTQINIAATRELADTDINGTTSVLESTYGLALTHYFRSYILADTSLEYEIEEFQGIGLEQKTLTAALNLTYILNQTARLIIGYEFNDIQTNDGADSQENLISLSLSLRR